MNIFISINYNLQLLEIVMITEQFIKIIQEASAERERLKRIYQPTLIDATKITGVQASSHHTEEPGSKEYERILAKQKRLIRIKKPQPDPEMAARRTESKVSQNELKKPWSKLSQGLKIQVALSFIDSLAHLLNEQRQGQLRYAIVSAITGKSLNKSSDLDYDAEQGQVRAIHGLVYDDHQDNFVFTGNNVFNAQYILTVKSLKSEFETDNEIVIDNLSADPNPVQSPQPEQSKPTVGKIKITIKKNI